MYPICGMLLNTCGVFQNKHVHADDDVLVVFECKGQSMDEPACVHTCVWTISLKEHVIAIIHVYYMYIHVRVHSGSCEPDVVFGRLLTTYTYLCFVRGARCAYTYLQVHKQRGFLPPFTASKVGGAHCTLQSHEIIIRCS